MNQVIKEKLDDGDNYLDWSSKALGDQTKILKAHRLTNPIRVVYLDCNQTTHRREYNGSWKR